MLESEFQSKVVGLAKKCGWLVFHDVDSRKNEAGFPDLVLVRGNRLLLVELKTQQGKVKPNQDKWLEALNRVDFVAAEVWRPHHMDLIISDLAERK